MHNTAHFYFKCLVFFCALATIGFLWLGCGKKGSPRPPQQPLPVAVKDLNYRIDNDVLELSWTVPVPDDHSASYPAAVKLFRFKQSAAETNCEKCPIRFNEIADLPVEMNRSEKSRSITMNFTETLEQGYRYIYKVIVYNADGIGGKDSNTIEFSF